MTDDIRFDPNALQALLRSKEGPVAVSLEKLGQTVERTAKRNCPVDTGRLRASIGHELGSDADGMYVVIGSDVEYAPFVEVKQPFLVPAALEARP